MLIICYIIVANASSSSIFYAKFEYSRQLTSYMSIYDWYEIPLNNKTESLKATLVWDELQTNGCCGLGGHRDWDSMRPFDLPPQYFPRSCCKYADKLHQGRGPFCSSSRGLYAIGCIEQAEQYWHNSKLYYMIYITCQIMLACISWNLGAEIKTNKPNEMKENRIEIQLSEQDLASSSSMDQFDLSMLKSEKLAIE